MSAPPPHGAPPARRRPAPRAVVNRAADPAAVPRPNLDAATFHAGLDGYAPTPIRSLSALAAELGLGAVALKDESDRLGLPAFKVLGASWAVERALRERPGVHTLVAASAGNHGRAVANVAARRGLAARIYLPARSAPGRRDAIAAEGAEIVVVDGSYEEAVVNAMADGMRDGVLELADVGDSPPAHWVIDGYATLFAEIAEQGEFDVVLVPTGVGSLAAAAARFGAAAGATVIAVEAENAACLTASLVAGEPASVATPGTSMAGLDCAAVSPAAWPSLRAGIRGSVTVADAEAHAAMRELAAAGLAIGDCGAATVAALRALATEPACRDLRDAAGLGPESRVLLIATEGPTDPAAYERVVGRRGNGDRYDRPQ
jgi:diaminopropionate ammonia-lyase